MTHLATRFRSAVPAAIVGLALVACGASRNDWSFEEEPPDPAWGPGSNTLFEANKDIVSSYCTFYGGCWGWEEEDEEECLRYLGWFYEDCPAETERRLTCTLEEYTCELLWEEGSDFQRCSTEENEMFDCLLQYD